VFAFRHSRRSIYAGFTGAWLIASFSACYSYQAARPHALTAEEAAHPVHVQRLHGGTVTLRAPHVSGDTLYGKPEDGAAEVAIPFSEIYTISAREKDSAKTTALAAGIALLVGIGVVGVAAAN
jgi:hypothetical protein